MLHDMVGHTNILIEFLGIDSVPNNSKIILPIVDKV